MYLKARREPKVLKCKSTICAGLFRDKYIATRQKFQAESALILFTNNLETNFISELHAHTHTNSDRPGKQKNEIELDEILNKLQCTEVFGKQETGFELWFKKMLLYYN